jgi:hypothetical protein
MDDGSYGVYQKPSNRMEVGFGACRGEIEKIDENGGGICTLAINAVLRWT